VDRIVGEHPRIIAVGMAQSDSKHPLPEEFMDLVTDLPGFRSIAHARGLLLAQPEPMYALDKPMRVRSL